MGWCSKFSVKTMIYLNGLVSRKKKKSLNGPRSQKDQPSPIQSETLKKKKKSILVFQKVLR